MIQQFYRAPDPKEDSFWSIGGNSFDPDLLSQAYSYGIISPTTTA